MSKENESKEGKRRGKVFAELLCDFMFKRLFGSEANKDVLIEFLNMVLEDVDIVDVEFIPTGHLGMTEEDRKAIFDISCRCRDGRSFIIEMQKAYQRHFRKRALYYTTYPINEQGRHARELYLKEKAEAKPGEKTEFKWDFDLKPVAVVAIVNFMFDHSDDWPEDRYHSSYRLREDRTGEMMTNVLRFVFLELGRFRKRIWELESRFDKWMYLLKHKHEMVEIPEEFSDPVFKRLFILARIGNFTAEELKQYEKSLDDMGDYYNTIRTAEEDAEKRGLERGLAEGEAKGRSEAQAEMARKMLAAGMPLEQIVQFTGLDAEAVEALTAD